MDLDAAKNDSTSDGLFKAFAALGQGVFHHCSSGRDKSNGVRPGLWHPNVSLMELVGCVTQPLDALVDDARAVEYLKHLMRYISKWFCFKLVVAVHAAKYMPSQGVGPGLKNCFYAASLGRGFFSGLHVRVKSGTCDELATFFLTMSQHCTTIVAKTRSSS